MPPSAETWCCPFCDHRVPYGTSCPGAPDTCERGEKNIHWYQRQRRIDGQDAIGIAAISDEESRQ